MSELVTYGDGEPFPGVIRAHERRIDPGVADAASGA